MSDFKELAALAAELDAEGSYTRAETVDNALAAFAKSKEKWMQKAVNPKKKGELRKKINTA